MGSGFAKLSGGSRADVERIGNMASAIDIGMRNARLRDQEMAELTRDPDWLRQCGFTGRSEDDF